jgi:hypothetical protein
MLLADLSQKKRETIPDPKIRTWGTLIHLWGSAPRGEGEMRGVT